MAGRAEMCPQCRVPMGVRLAATGPHTAIRTIVYACVICNTETTRHCPDAGADDAGRGLR